MIVQLALLFMLAAAAFLGLVILFVAGLGAACIWALLFRMSVQHQRHKERIKAQERQRIETEMTRVPFRESRRLPPAVEVWVSEG